ncbi:uncharacterized protein LOC123565062 isoform X2 [Mercenaria mercenaria]|uniref:uncharacterized protein LOC123565062 isoform X2 n=1 Tax=Mercenaria mercenaria TaxID=6596 RepID=UPI00234E3CD4|nr:uncharacterized protein LOC123565062 isoform X2 [Mercenaria mercenaria]
MSCEIETRVRVLREEIVRCIKEPTIVSHLEARSVISTEEGSRIKNLYLKDETCKAGEDLLECVLNSKEPGKWKSFEDALESSDYQHLKALLLSNNNFDEFSAHAKTVMRLFTPYLEKIVIAKEFVSELRARDVINGTDEEVIMAMFANKGDIYSTMVLLERMQCRVPARKWYYEFLDVLMQKDHQQIVQEMEPDFIANQSSFLPELDEECVKYSKPMLSDEVKGARGPIREHVVADFEEGDMGTNDLGAPPTPSERQDSLHESMLISNLKEFNIKPEMTKSLHVNSADPTGREEARYEDSGDEHDSSSLDSDYENKESETEGAQTILKNQPLYIDGHTSDLKVYRDELRTVQVQGLPNIGRHLDAVTLYFKNRTWSGGGPVVKCTSDKDNDVAYVTFEIEEVAQRVVDRPGHYLKGQLLDVSLYKPKEKSGNTCKDSVSRKILITGLPSSVDKDFVEIYFDDFESTCIMQVESVYINPDDATAVVQFRDQAAVDFILRSQTLQMKGQTISVQVYEEKKEDFYTIKVHGPSDIERELDKLLLYFKNKKRSDGGLIVNSSVDTGKNVAYITFKDQEVAERVVAKDHSKQGLEVMLVRDRSADEVSTDQNVSTVKVRGVQKILTKDILTYYFENEKRSGGGPIQSIWSDDEDENVVFITFSKSEDARKVVDRKHEIQKCSLQASLYPPPPFYDNKVLIKGVQSSKNALFLFLEANANAEPISVDYHEEEETTVLVTMKTTTDFEKLEKACKERTLEGARLTVSKVQISNCIFVSNLSPVVTKETVQYYFENKKKSGGGDVEKVVMNEDEVERTCLVYFEDYKVIDSILDRQHNLGAKEVEVKCFQTALGPPEGETVEKTFQVPRAFEIKDADVHKVKFVANSPEQRKSFEQELLKQYTEVKWPTDTETHMHVQLHCTLTKDTKGCFNIAKSWEKQAKSVFSKLMDAIVLYRIYVLEDIKPEVMDFLKIIHKSEPTNVAIVTEKEQKVFVIVGKKAIADDLEVKIQDTIKKIIHGVKKERQKVTEVFTNIKPIETKMMVFEKLPESLEKEFGDIKVQIAVEKNEIHLQGLMSSIKNAELAIYDKKSRFEIQHIDNISKLVLSLLRLGKTSSSLQQKLRSNGIPAVWEIYANGIAVCCSKPGFCEKALEVIRTFFHEDTISTERCTVPDLETDKWRSKVEEIHAMHPGEVQIVLSDDLTKIHVCGTADIEKSVIEEVQGFLRSNTIVTMNVSNSREANCFLEKNCKTEIDDISRKLQQYYVKIRSLEQYRGFEIRGLQTGVQEANLQLQKLMNGIQQKKHTVSKPGIAEHIRSAKGKDSIHTIEMRLSCVIVVEEDEAYNQTKPVRAGSSSVGILSGAIGPKRVTTLRRSNNTDVLGMAASSDEKGVRGRNVEPDFNSVTFIVFALSADTIRTAIRKLEDSLEKEMVTKVIDSHTICQLEDHQVDEMIGIAIQYHVHISMDNNRGIVKLTGIFPNIMTASEKINAFLRDAEWEELMKSVAQWFYIEMTLTSEDVRQYEKDINLTIEKAYRQQKDSVTFSIDGIDYILDFASMEEYPEHDSTDKVNVFRRDLVKGGTYEVPGHWDDMRHGNLRVVSLNSDLREYTDIEQMFKDSAKRNKGSNEQTKDWTVVKIERIQNKSLWEQYQSKKKQLEDQNRPGTFNERELWHGTSADLVDSINVHGFNPSLCGKNDK